VENLYDIPTLFHPTGGRVEEKRERIERKEEKKERIRKGERENKRTKRTETSK
jgi:hypothetical protein